MVYPLGGYGVTSYSRSSAFVSTWNTENLGGTGSATKVILLPMSAGVEVDWGDGTVNNLNTHTYVAGGIKTITIEDTITGFRFVNGGDKLKILTISSAGNLVIDANNMFRGCSNMSMWKDSPGTTVTTSTMFRMFLGCSSLSNISLLNLDTSLVTNMEAVFASCTSLINIDLSNFSTASSTKLNFMFQSTGVTSPTGVDNFDVTQVTTMASMFLGVTLDTSFYSSLLVNYEAQAVQNSVSLDGGNSLYSVGAATTARANLIADHTWSITDGGQEP